MGDHFTPKSTFDAVGRRRFDRDPNPQPHEEDDTWPHEEDDTWRREAACIGLGDLFFIERGASTRPAKTICAGCPVITECLDYALNAHIRLGIWGGLTEKQRLTLIRKRRREAV